MTQTYTKLMTAAWNNSAEEVKQLIDQGADVNEKNKAGVTALMGAAFNEHAEIAILTNLLKNFIPTKIRRLNTDG